jgi:hypothetical protein
LIRFKVLRKNNKEKKNAKKELLKKGSNEKFRKHKRKNVWKKRHGKEGQNLRWRC